MSSKLDTGYPLLLCIVRYSGMTTCIAYVEACNILINEVINIHISSIDSITPYGTELSVTRFAKCKVHVLKAYIEGH